MTFTDPTIGGTSLRGLSPHFLALNLAIEAVCPALMESTDRWFFLGRVITF